VALHKANYREDIQFLRGIAVLAVILFHAEKKYFPLGYLGVDLFFVISGFVVTPLIMRIFETPHAEIQVKLNGVKDFYVKRFYRLAPALGGMLFFAIIVVFLFGSVGDHEKFAKQGIATLLLVGNLGAYKYNIDYFSPNPNPLLHTWSLSVEEQIYLVLPLLVLFLSVILGKAKNIKIVFLVSSLVFGFLSFILFLSPRHWQELYQLIGVSSASQFSFYSPVSRIWQFLLGGITALLPCWGGGGAKKRHLNKYLYLSGLATLCFILYSKIQLEAKIASVFVTVLASFVISQIHTRIFPHLFCRVFIWLGDRSYSLYLYHMPILYVAKHSQVFGFNINENREIPILIALIFTLTLGNFSYLYIENKFRHKSGIDAKQVTTVQIVTTVIFFIVIFTSISKTANLEIFRDANSPMSTEISPQEWDKNCKFHQPTNPLRTWPCFYGFKQAEKNFLLIGDSHAGHLSKTLIRIGKKEKANIFIFTHSACPFITDPGVLSFKNKYPLVTKECLRHNNQVLYFLDRVKIDSIFYTQRSTVPYVSAQTLQSRIDFNNLVKDSLAKLKSYGSEIIFLGITPEYISIDTFILKLLNRKGFYNPIPRIDNSFWSSELYKSEIKYVDFYTKFCTSFARCNFQNKGVWLFVDNDHLSQAGGKFIEPEIMKAIEEIE
jgi:peptidoglycan/LPS O-acetylase OafA/YrhL